MDDAAECGASSGGADRTPGTRAPKNAVLRVLHAGGFQHSRVTPRLSKRAGGTRTGTPSSGTSMTQAKRFLAAGDPVISIDTKKKELVGLYCAKGQGMAGEGGPAAGPRS